MKKIELTFLITTLLLLINLPIANSFIIHQTNPDQTIQKQNHLIKDSFNLLINLLKSFLTIKQIATVSAIIGDSYCCPLTNLGQKCVDVEYGFTDCAQGYSILPGTCSINSCWRCCKETNDGDLCKTVQRGYDNCKNTLIAGTCNQRGCRILRFNEQEIYTQSIDINIPGGAGNLGWNCCPEMKDGSICMDIASIDTDSCAVTQLPTSCEETADCGIGCCFDPENGLCTESSTKKKCLDNGGVWLGDDKDCNYLECKKGCCVLGGNSEFATEKRCEKLALTRGHEKDFRQINNEIECLALSEQQKQGACVINTKCSFTSESECLTYNGDFYENYLCSNPTLNTSCEKQTNIGCVEGKDEIYWFDSCGNRENIYSSNKISSYNNGKVLAKNEACNPNSPNINSDHCGNCNSALGSNCKEVLESEPSVQDGNFICKSLGCPASKDTGNVDKKNGESWCLYDSYIGDGKDTPGSRHWKMSCIEGEIIPEPCADARGSLCTEAVIEEGSKKFSTASCVINEAKACLHYNGEDEMVKLCQENTHCQIKSINVDNYFKFDICTPKYPKGFDFDAPENKDACAIASQTCTVFYVKDWKGRWKCKENCNCKTAEFSKQMNDLCISIGDCGTYINYAGEGTKNTKVSGAPDLKWQSYTNFANYISSQSVEPQELERSLKLVGTGIEETGTPPAPGVTSLGEAINKLGQISGTGGGLITTGMVLGKAFPSLAVQLSPAIYGTLQSISAAAVGASLGMMGGGYLADELGLTGEGALVMQLAGGVGGLFIGLSILKGAWVCPYCIAGAAVVMIYTAVIGWGDTKEERVEFKCMPWQPPTGGDDCELCNDNPLKPCSEYRCESLGKACKIINENTQNPKCIAITPEPNPPIITPTKVLTEDYEFQNQEIKRVEIRKNNGDCIKEYQEIIFQLKTDEYAQCKYSFNQTPTYEDMENYPEELTLYDLNHTFRFKMPDIDSLTDITGDAQRRYAESDLYIKCQDYHGNFNRDAFVIDICIKEENDMTPPIIKSFQPENNQFLEFGKNNSQLKIYLNKPATCRYSTSPGVPYEEMFQEMSCKTDTYNINDIWTCNTALTNLKKGENNFYIKCKNKPWVETEEEIIEYGERVANTNDYSYTLHVSESLLHIDSIKINSEVKNIDSGETIIFGGTNYLTVELEVKTSGGAENGKATCFWAEGLTTSMLKTGSTIHKQTLNSRSKGNYKIPIKCQDKAGNTALNDAIFTLDIDNSPPIAVRAFKDGGNLKVITDEKAECYYDEHRCNFNLKNATSMTTALSNSHKTSWEPGTTYYIKCADIWNNQNPGCAIIVQPSKI